MAVYPQMPMLRVDRGHACVTHVIVVYPGQAKKILYVYIYIDWPICPILGFWGSKVLQMGDALLRTPMNHLGKI